MTPFIFYAKVLQDEGNGKWFVRLFRRDFNDVSDGGEFVGICEANGIHEAEMIVACINAVADGGNEDAMVLVRRMFEWSRFNEAPHAP